MAHGRVLGALLVREEAGPDLIARPREVVHDGDALAAPLERVRQARVGAARARELGGPARRRHDARGEERAERGHCLEGAVAMPQHVGELVDHAAVVGRNDLASLDVEVGLARERRTRRRVHAARDLEPAEALAEGDLLLVVQVLAAEQQDGVLLEGGANVTPRRIVHRAGDVDAVDLRGEVWSQARSRYCHRCPLTLALSPGGETGIASGVASGASTRAAPARSP